MSCETQYLLFAFLAVLVGPSGTISSRLAGLFFFNSYKKFKQKLCGDGGGFFFFLFYFTSQSETVLEERVLAAVGTMIS